jgi:hypothetical protein
MTIGMIFLTIYPIAATYYQALKLANLPRGRTAILGLCSTTAALAGMYFACELISQMKEACVLDLLTIIAAFLLNRHILKNGPAFFTKHFFQHEESPKEEAN